MADSARQLGDVDQQEDAFAVVGGQRFLRPAFSGWAPPRTSFLTMAVSLLGFTPLIPDLQSSRRGRSPNNRYAKLHHS